MEIIMNVLTSQVIRHVKNMVDSLYCPSCLENMSTTEARLKKNRCANCRDCPSCQHTLSTRVCSVQVDPTDPQSATKKSYYLGCTCCWWTSRDVGLQDQNVATGGWQDKENPHSKRIQDLLEYYRMIGQREKFELEKKKSSKKKKSSYLTASEKYRLSSSFSSLTSRKSLGSGGLFSSNFKVEPSSCFEIMSSEAVDEVPALPEDIFTQNSELATVSSLDQRLYNPETQPQLTEDLYPMHKHILVKRNHRCLQCEHNLSKTEYNPSSIKFKIQLGAFHHVPEIRLMREVELKRGVESTVQLTLCNPTPHNMTVALLPFVPEAHQEDQKREEVLAGTSLTQLSLSQQQQQRYVVRPRENSVGKLHLCSQVRLPQGELILAARDDTAEYDDSEKPVDFKDDPQVVAWRRANKVGVNVYVTPDENEDTDVVVGLVLRYDYTNTVTTNTEPRTATINIPTVVVVGKIAN